MVAAALVAALLVTTAIGWVERGREPAPTGANPRLSMLVLPFDNLRAFRRTLALDPRYALAYEDITFLLTSAAGRNSPYVLVGSDRFAARGGAGSRC